MKHFALATLILSLLTLTRGYSQSRLSIGVQIHNGFTRPAPNLIPAGTQITPLLSFATGANLYLQYRLFDKWAVRIQSEVLYQGLNYSIEDQDFTLAFIPRERTVNVFQLASGLQLVFQIFESPEKTVRIDMFSGTGIRSAGSNQRGILSSTSATWGELDSTATATVSVASLDNQGICLEFFGGLRIAQQLSQHRSKSIWLEFGIGYRSPISTLSVIQGAVFSTELNIEEDPLTPGRRFVSPFPVQDGFQQDLLEDNPDDLFIIQHLGRQLDVQIGLQFDL